MSWEQRNADFCNAQTDAQMAYIEAEREVDRLQTENAKLRHDLEEANNQAEEVCIENAKLRELVRDMWHEGMCECGSRGKCASCEYDYPTRMRELGLEEEE